MTDSQILVALVGLLTTVIGGLGARVITRLDAMVDKLNSVAGELHTRINGLDTRLTRVETKTEKDQ